MIDDPVNIPFDPPDAGLVCANYLKTCEMLGIEPTPREQALGLIQEWSELLSGRSEPTTHQRSGTPS